MKNNWKYQLLLILAAMIWGSSFVAQSSGADVLGPWTFTCLRYLTAFLSVSAMIPFMDRVRHTEKPVTRIEEEYLRKAAVYCGLAVCAGSVLQQAALSYTTVGKAGFLTSLYVVLVPVLAVFLGAKLGWNVWLAVVTAITGIYFLSYAGDRLALGDILLLLCAAVFAVQIMLVSWFSPHTDPVRLSRLECLVCAIVCAVPMIIFEKPSLSEISQAAATILYAGIMSSGAAYTLQVITQSKLDPTLASIIMSLESVFAAVFGFLILHEVLSPRELAGCALVFAAIILAQLPMKRKPAKNQ